MTNPNIPSEEQIQDIDPARDRVAVREEDEGYRLNIYFVDSESVPESSAKTYTRAFGHYFVDEESDATETLDEMFAEFTSEHSVIDSFGRRVGQAYEISVEVREDINGTDYVFRRSNAATIELPSRSDFSKEFDEFLAELEEEIEN